MTIGCSVIDLGELAKALGFKQPDYGGYEKQSAAINALIAYVNKNGGMGGRQVTSIDQEVRRRHRLARARPRRSARASPRTRRSPPRSSTAATRTTPSRASRREHAARACRRCSRSTRRSSSSTRRTCGRRRNPEYTGFVKAQLNAMNERELLRRQHRRAAHAVGRRGVARVRPRRVVEPYLKSIGVTKMQASYIDSTNTGTLGATSAAALTAGKNGNLNRVVVIGGARIEPVALSVLGVDRSVHIRPLSVLSRRQTNTPDYRIDPVNLAGLVDQVDGHGPSAHTQRPSWWNVSSRAAESLSNRPMSALPARDAPWPLRPFSRMISFRSTFEDVVTGGRHRGRPGSGRVGRRCVAGSSAESCTDRRTGSGTLPDLQMLPQQDRTLDVTPRPLLQTGRLGDRRSGRGGGDVRRARKRRKSCPSPTGVSHSNAGCGRRTE